MLLALRRLRILRWFFVKGLSVGAVSASLMLATDAEGLFMFLPTLSAVMRTNTSLEAIHITLCSLNELKAPQIYDVI